ncbi:UNVERIFIED_CONTAM: hypothetical protein DES50_10575 [Williamsia faeni]
MRIDPAVVHEYSKDVWKIADAVAEVRLDTMFLQASAACEGTDLVKGFATHAHDQHLEVQSIAKDCDDFGTSLKSTADTVARQESDNEQLFTNLPSSRRA